MKRSPADCQRGDSGFTLIELLVVTVVIPLIIGGIAEALIVSFNTESSNSSRISDTLNAQVAQEYFPRDVQGASYITRADNSGTSGTAASAFSPTSPEVCGPGAGAPGSPSLLVGLYRPPVASGSALDVAYWQTGTGASTEIDRYSCTLNSSFGYTTTPVRVVIATPPGPSLDQAVEAINPTVEIDPAQFDSAAQLGWTTVAAFTTASVPPAYSGGTLTVASTAGFTTGVITVTTTQGPAPLTCTGLSATTFTGCSGAASVVSNSTVTQSNVTAVKLGFSEPASSYDFSLVGVPRPASSPLGSPPALLILGPSGIASVHGASCPDGNHANICVGQSSDSGGVIMDSTGASMCGAVRSYFDFQSGSGTVYTVGPPASSSCSVNRNGRTVGSLSATPDPLAGVLPNNGCLPSTIISTANLATNPAPVNGNAVPGVYTTPLQGTLEPGLYIVEDGILSITGMASDSNGGGVLLYVPGPGPYNGAQGCYTYNSAEPLSGSVTGIVPMNAAQSENYFGGNPTLGGNGGVWLWQDVTNTSSVSVSGYTQGGILYAPGANFEGLANSLATGGMIVNGMGSSSLIDRLHLCLNWPSYSATC